MTATVNASTSAGVVVTSDTSGALALQTGGTTALTVDSSQNVGVGTTTPDIFSNGFARSLGVAVTGTGATCAINVSGGAASRIQFGVGSTRYGLIYQDASNFMQIATTTALPISFVTNNAEGMRLTSSNYLKASNTGTYIDPTGALHEFSNSANSNTLAIRNSNGSLTTNAVLYVDANVNTTNNTFYAFSYYNNGAGAYKLRIADSGNVINTNNSYGGISDVKLKENIVDATPKLADLMQVKVRHYNLKSDPTHKQIGVIAQELETVFPSMIDESQDRDKDGNDLGTTTKGVKYSVFIPMLIKSIQELSTQVTELKAEVATLRGTQA